MLVALVMFATGCDSPPRNHFIQWVTRDAWDPICGPQAAVEKISITNARWVEPGKVYSVDIDATYKLLNPCSEDLQGRSYKQFQSVDFKKANIEIVPCKRNGEEGWSLKDRDIDLCWTGPNRPKYTQRTIKKKIPVVKQIPLTPPADQ